MPAFNNVKDVLLHVKNKIKGVGVVKKTIYPITRWENILGAPRMITPETLEDSYPSEYALYAYGELTISDEEFEACFGKLQ